MFGIFIMNHELKIWPEHFDNIVIGKKTFEIRKNDRDYKSGDTLILKRFNPDRQEYTGATCNVYVSHILYGTDNNWGLNRDCCIMSIHLLFVNGQLSI